jgi:inorganic pyrophosphatase
MRGIEWLISGLCLVFSCQPDYRDLEPFGDNGLRVVIEMPAGSVDLFAFDGQSGDILPILKEGRQRSIDVLPFPANFGFVPGTSLDISGNAVGAPVRIMVLGPHLSTGTVTETRLIGLLKVKEGGKEKQMLLASPLTSTNQEQSLQGFQDFLLYKDSLKRAVEDWFVFYRNLPDTQIIGWDDEKAALKVVQQASLRK